MNDEPRETEHEGYEPPAVEDLDTSEGASVTGSGVVITIIG